jgi:hypothetical protein
MIRTIFRSIFISGLSCALLSCASTKPAKSYSDLYTEAGQRQEVIDVGPTANPDESEISSGQAQYMRMGDVEQTEEIRIFTGGARNRIGGEIDPETGMPIAAGAGVSSAGVEPTVVASLPASGSFEITADDISGNRLATSANITVFGLKLGDHKNLVLKKIGSSGKYDDRTRTFTGSGLLIKFDKKKKIISIGMSSEFKSKLKGRTPELIDTRIFTDENFRQKRIAAEDGIVEGQVTLPGGHSFKTITYQFFARGMEVTGTNSGDSFTFNYFTLVPVQED